MSFAVMSFAEKMTAIADAIRGKTGKTDKLSLDEMATEINEISTGERDINPEWTNWSYFSRNNNRNDLAAKLKYSDTSNGTDFSDMFINCSDLMSIPAFDTSNGTNFNCMFVFCDSLVTISQLNFTKATTSYALSDIFYACGSLINLNIAGTINATGLNVQYSPLSHDSLMSIINALADKIGVSGTWKVTLGATNLAKLTAEEIAIAEGKGWTLA